MRPIPATMLLITSLTVAGGAAADTITVTSGTDDGAGSLRAALATAQDGDVITFGVGVDNVTLASTLEIDEDVTIDGGAGFMLRGDDAVGIMEIDGAEVVLRSLLFVDGLAASGGAIHNLGDLAIEGCQFTGNYADTGGAIASDGTLTVHDTKFWGNHSTVDSGGAIVATGETVIVNTTFMLNVAETGTGAGGAILALDAGADVTVNHCTLNQNTAGGYGGAIATMGGNVTIESSIIYANTAPAGADVYGEVTSDARNVIGDDADADGLADDVIGEDPIFGELTGNTLAIGLDSPAIDLGSCSEPGGTLLTDALGADRPSGVACDAGAFEYPLAALSREVDVEPGTECELGGTRTDFGWDYDEDGELSDDELADVTPELDCADDPDPPADGGGCQSGAGGSGGAALSLVVLGMVLRRRRT